MGREPDITSVAAPATRPVVPRARIRSCRLPTWSPVVNSSEGSGGAAHRVRRASRFLRDRHLRGRAGAFCGSRGEQPGGLQTLANSLGPDDQVALEATGNALAIA